MSELARMVEKYKERAKVQLRRADGLAREVDALRADVARLTAELAEARDHDDGCQHNAAWDKLFAADPRFPKPPVTLIELVDAALSRLATAEASVGQLRAALVTPDMDDETVAEWEPGWGRAADELLARVEAALDEAERRGEDNEAARWQKRLEPLLTPFDVDDAAPPPDELDSRLDLHRELIALAAAVKVWKGGKG